MSGSPAAFWDCEALEDESPAPGRQQPLGSDCAELLPGPGFSQAETSLPPHAHVLSGLRYWQPNSVFNGI